MDAHALAAKLTSGAWSIASEVIATLRKLPPGTYVVTNQPEKGKGTPWGIVNVKKKGWKSTSGYKTSFTSLIKDAGEPWEGELEAKFDIMCEGPYRYLYNHDCGTHRVYLMKDGILKVQIFHKGTFESELFWLKANI